MEYFVKNQIKISAMEKTKTPKVLYSLKKPKKHDDLSPVLNTQDCCIWISDFEI
jgi:hypothetical protein